MVQDDDAFGAFKVGERAVNLVDDIRAAIVRGR